MQAKEICLLVNHNTRYYSHSIWEQLLYSLDQTPRYYLFHHPILCGIYSRVATNWEWCLLIPANLSLIPRPLLHFQCTLNTADESEESDPFADIEDEDELEENEFVLDDSQLYC